MITLSNSKTRCKSQKSPLLLGPWALLAYETEQKKLAFEHDSEPVQLALLFDSALPSLEKSLHDIVQEERAYFALYRRVGGVLVPPACGAMGVS